MTQSFHGIESPPNPERFREPELRDADHADRGELFDRRHQATPAALTAPLVIAAPRVRQIPHRCRSRTTGRTRATSTPASWSISTCSTTARSTVSNGFHFLFADTPSSCMWILTSETLNHMRKTARCT